MPAIPALQHLFSSVERGYTSGRGRGFQTAAVSRELAGTEDLKVLEKAAFYAIPRERRAAGELPVKEVFFHLPSGRVALGRTVDWGQDSMGRDGNYLAHHLILEREAFVAAGANPFPFLDAADLAAPGTDLTPRDLPALELRIDPLAGDPEAAAGIPTDLLASLALNLVEPEGNAKTPPRPILLLGETALAARMLRGLLASLEPEQRIGATLCTHFYESGSLRSFFRLMAVGSRAEMPSQSGDYLLYDVARKEFPERTPATPYGQWLAAQLRQGAWKEIRGYHEVRHALHAGEPNVKTATLAAETRDTLWRREEEKLLGTLKGNPALIAAFLKGLPSGRDLSNQLLRSPLPELIGTGAAAENTAAALAELRGAASPARWRRWLRQHADQPFFEQYRGDLVPWWVKTARGVLDLLPKRN